MHKAIIEIRCKKPSLVKKSLEVDRENIKIKALRKKVKIEIYNEKISHLKGIINSYLDLIKMLEEVEESGKSQGRA